MAFIIFTCTCMYIQYLSMYIQYIILHVHVHVPVLTIPCIQITDGLYGRCVESGKPVVIDNVAQVKHRISLVGCVEIEYCLLYIHVLMRDGKEERKKQARSNKQTRQSNTARTCACTCLSFKNMYMYILLCMYMYLLIPQDMSYNPAVDTINGMLIWAELILSHMRHDKTSRHTCTCIHVVKIDQT